MRHGINLIKIGLSLMIHHVSTTKPGLSLREDNCAGSSITISSYLLHWGWPDSSVFLSGTKINCANQGPILLTYGMGHNFSVTSYASRGVPSSEDVTRARIEDKRRKCKKRVPSAETLPAVTVPDYVSWSSMQLIMHKLIQYYAL